MILTIVRGARVLAGLSAALALLAGAWPAPARADDGSGVARISSLNGTVTMQRADSGDTVAAAINAPVSVGDYISTGQASRTEVQLDAANFVRVGSSSQLRFTNLDPTDSTLQVAQGTIEVRVLDVTGDRPLVQTPSIGIRPAVAGRYRINVTNDGDTLVSVRSGSATLVSPLGSQTIATGTTVMVSGSSSNPQVSTVANIAYDDFDSWNSQRDQFVAAAAGDPYANTGIPGLADLDSYGHWVSYPSYGQVWVASSYPANWRRIRTAVGSGSCITVGPGSGTNRGAGRPTIMDVGSTRSASAGRGIRVRSTCAPCTGRRWSPSSDSAAAAAASRSTSRSATSAGCRWRRTSRIIRGGVRAT